MSKYELPLFRDKAQVYRLVPAGKDNWLVPVDILNVADSLHVHRTDERSTQRSMQGYGGSTLEFQLEDGSIYMAKGPWHSSARGLLKDTGIDVTDLHATMVTLWAVEDRPVTFKKHVPASDGSGRLEYKEVTEPRPCKIDPPIYEEKVPALGMFMRGERIAHAYANATGNRVYVRSESYGGGSEHLVSPGDEMHIMARNYE